MNDIFALLLQYKMYIGIGIVVIVVFLSLRSDVLQGQIRKVVKVLLGALAIGLGYYFLTGNSPLTIPGDINSYFSDPQLQDEPSHIYYRDPEKEYGDQIK